MLGRVLIFFVGILPKKFMSRIAGHVARVSLPGPLRRLQLRAFFGAFGVNFDEVKAPLASFQNVQEFFVRELKDGARPIDDAPAAFVSPCDGAWGQAGVVENGTLLQVKGRPYSVGALLGDDELAKRFEGGAYATLYLSPKDYHRFHTPCAGDVTRADYLPGSLWPVNRAGVQFVEALFAQNERIVAYLEPPGGHHCVAMVAVGATMVGKVKIDFDDLETNIPRRGKSTREYEGEQRPHFERGGQWGRFEFGSTIVLLTTPGFVTLDVQPAGTPLVLGTRIGSLA
jgi:phosphatidylserine decarboxylase